MPEINKLIVMNQIPHTDLGGIESCGYHTFKNSILAMMHMQGIITEKQFETMRNDINLFRAIFNKLVEYHNNGDIDVLLPQFMEFLSNAHNGDYDFSQHGVSKADLKKLKLTPDGTQNITVANYMTDVFSPGHGLSGMVEDLLVAAATVKLARTKGEAKHVFALGLNNAHWITVTLTQNAKGERTWGIMDSWANQTLYHKTVVNKIETVLTKTKQEIDEYLQEVYENSSLMFDRRYNAFFDKNTGLPLPVKINGLGAFGNLTLDAKGFFIDQKDNMEQFTIWIGQRHQFMESVGWLTSTGDVEKARVKQLYNLSQFMLDNADENDLFLKDSLQPICEQLKASIAITSKVGNVASAPIQQPDIKVSPEEVDAQAAAAQFAVNEGVPKPTEGFVARFVNAIKALWETVKSVIEYVARSIGLVS